MMHENTHTHALFPLLNKDKNLKLIIQNIIRPITITKSHVLIVMNIHVSGILTFKCIYKLKYFELNYKHTKHLIQAYCTKHLNISTPSLSTCFFTVGMQAHHYYNYLLTQD